MKIDIITLFPTQIEEFSKFGLLRIAQEKELLELNVHDLRKWSTDKHKTVDDRPYGGGPGMILKVEPIASAIEELKQDGTKVIITTPRGRKLDQKIIRELSEDQNSHYILICGHYEGFDERVYEKFVDIEISVGDFILSGGELPALLLVDAITRLVPGVLGNSESASDESFESDLIEFPQYTRPEIYDGLKVPEVLLSGNHEEIRKWREKQSMKMTKDRRPDLL